MDFLPFIMITINIIFHYLYKKTKLSIYIFILTLITSTLFGYIEVIAIPFILTYCVLLYYLYNSKKYNKLIFFAVIIFSILFSAHKIIGFNSLLLMENIKLSSQSIEFQIFLHLDKIFVGLAILVFANINYTKISKYKYLLKIVFINYIVLVCIMIDLSFILDMLNFDIKFPSFDILILWSIKMIFFTVLVEELFFRYLLFNKTKEYFDKYKYKEYIALSSTSLLFGLAHFTGGIDFVLLATIAGFFYGIVYMKTNSIEASILLHFLINLTHLILFSYPIAIS